MISQIKIQIIETMLITSLFFYSLSVNSFLSDFFHSAREDVNCEVKYIRYIIKCYIILSYMIIYYIYDIIIIITIGLQREWTVGHRCPQGARITQLHKPFFLISSLNYKCAAHLTHERCTVLSGEIKVSLFNLTFIRVQV